MSGTDEYYSEQIKLLLKTNQILLAATTGDLQAVVAAAYRVLEHPVLLGDSILNVIAWAGPEIEGDKWEDYIKQGYAPDWHLPEPNSISENTIKLNDEFFAVKIFNSVHLVYDYIIDFQVANEKIAHLVVSGIGEPMSEKHFNLLTVLCLSILGRLQQLKGYPALKESREQFFLQLLTEEPEELTLRCRSRLVNLSSEGIYHLLVVDIAQFQPVSVSISTLSRSLEAAVSGSSVIYQDKLILLIQSNPVLYGNGASYHPVVETLLRDNVLFGAVSRCFYKLKDMRWHFDRCCQVLSLVPFWSKSSCPVCLYNDLEDYVMLSSLPKDFLSNQNIHPIIQTLIASGRESKFDMIETLYAYLLCAQHSKSTCQKLCIHRNTLDYRISRINDLTNIDWGNGALLHALYRSIIMLRYINNAQVKQTY